MASCSACGYQAEGPFRFCPECGARAHAPGREQRKVVTVLFCDVAGSTALGESIDAEALRSLLARYFERMKAIVERHGGVVEKFIGDAVMAVFGLPAVHEDDAVRALRAAEQMQMALAELGIQGRIGVSSGEVVTGTEERLATGDTVNVAARLQQAAEPGRILLGETTLRLAGDAVDAEPLEPRAVKGKREPVRAWRLVSVSTAAAERRFDSPLVGRQRELVALGEAWERAHRGPGCELVTVVGAAGVGKSRLVAEFLHTVDAPVVRGRCLSYGEGITYWPVVEVLKQLDSRRSRVELDPLAGDAIDALLGQGTASTEEIAWAFRKLLEAVAAGEALVAVFDDVHWGEEVFLDLLEHVAFLSTGAPILLLCMARPELLDRRSGWSGVVRLQPLAHDEAAALMQSRLGDGANAANVRERILLAAGGNPLFVEEMAAMVQASGAGELEVPPTLQALLAARLDQLDPPERSVLERGSVEGEVFHHGAVQAMSHEQAGLMPQLTALVRKELIRPDRPVFAGEDAFQFRHLLMRDAAYEALPKAERGALHEQFADWLEQRGAELVELDELLGYHLEQAFHYRQELGHSDADMEALAARAGERLKKAGSRAVARQDFRAGVALLERAARLLPDELRDGRLEVELGYARFSTGQGAEAVLSGLAEAAERAAAAEDCVTALALRIDRAAYELVFETTEANANRLRELVDEALPAIEASGDDWALAVAYGPLVVTAEVGGRYAAMASAAERVVEHARLAEDPLMLSWAQIQLVHAQYVGTTPVEECLRWLDEHLEVERRSALSRRALLLAALGRFDEARRLLSEAAERIAELGAVRLRTSLAWRRFEVAMLEGDPVGAEEAAREACEGAQATGELGNYMSFCCSLAQALLGQGRIDEAEEALARGETADSDERHTQMLMRQVRGKVLAQRGEFEEGERLAREAVTIAAETDMLNAHADALVDLAEVLTLTGKDVRAELEQALALYERKGNLVMAGRTRSRLAEPAVPQ